MIALCDYIQELRVELRGCLTRRERATVEAELAAAIAAKRRAGRNCPGYDRQRSSFRWCEVHQRPS